MARTGSTRSKVSPLVWVYISGVALALTLVGAVAYIAFAGQLTFIPNWLYYLLLLPVGLAAAAFLSGALRSHAKFTGQGSYGTIELTGPAVVAGLVVVGGLLLANRETTFSLIVRVHGPAGPTDVIREGAVTLDLGQDRRTAPIGGDGRVVFSEVSASLAGRTIRLIPEVPGHVARDTAPVMIPPERVVDLALVRASYATPVSGIVTDSANRLVRDAVVSFNAGAVTATTDAQGQFRATVPFPPGSVVPLIVTVNGQVAYDNTVTIAEQPPLRLQVRSP